MSHTSAQVIYKRINVIKRSLSETDNVKAITERLEAEGIESTETQTKEDIRLIYRGAYPDSWLDNFLNIVYPEMFKETIKDLSDIKAQLKTYTQTETNGSKNVITALNSMAKIDIELINLIHKGPSVRMMRGLKVKADKLARALEEERTITKSTSKYGT